MHCSKEAAGGEREREGKVGGVEEEGGGWRRRGALCFILPRAEAREAPRTATGITLTRLEDTTATQDPFSATVT